MERNFEWYLKLKEYGGGFTMTVSAWPEWYVYMKYDKEGTVKGWRGHPGDQGAFIATPNGDGTFLLSTKKWPNWYLCMQDNKEGNVRGCEGDPGPQGHWYFTVKDITEHKVMLSAAKPGWFIFMQGVGDNHVKSWKGDPGPQGHFIVEYT